MNKKLIYPPFYRYKQKFIPYKYDLNQMKEIRGTEINRKNKYWGKLYQKIDKIYKTPKKILPIKTLLYRCSIYENPNTFGKSHTKSPVIYFGLDFIISTWIALEIYQRDNKINNFFLHIYESNKEIDYVYIESVNGGTIPEIDIESAKSKICVHAQKILHGNNYGEEYDELGTEISFSRKSNFKQYISHIQTYHIDVKKLEKNVEKFIFEWNPKNALY